MSTGAVRNHVPVRGRGRKTAVTTGMKPLVLKLSHFSEDNFPVRVRELSQPPAKAIQMKAGVQYRVENSIEQPGTRQSRRRIRINSIDVITNSNIVS